MNEKTIREQFSISLEIDAIVLSHIPVSRVAVASVFLTKKKQLYAYISSQSAITLADVRKIATHMNLKVEAYLPPKNRVHYFDEIGTAKFQETFPGRRVTHTSDIAFYRTLAPYNPALLLISEVIGGEICQFDPDSITSWRTATKLTYRRIKTI